LTECVIKKEKLKHVILRVLLYIEYETISFYYIKFFREKRFFFYYINQIEPYKSKELSKSYID